MAEYYNPGYRSPIAAINEGLNVAANIYGIKQAKEAQMRLAAKDEEEKTKLAQESAIASPEETAYLKETGLDVSKLTNKQNAEYQKLYAGEKFKNMLKPPKEVNQLEDDYKRSQIAKNYADIRKDKDTALKTPKFSEGQSNAATFAKRMEQSQQNIEDVLSKKDAAGNIVYDPSGYGAGAMNTSLPFVGNIVPERFKTEEHKLFTNAKNDFISAVLRKESGAAISQGEFDKEDMKYFPQAGDSDAVKAQKAQLRAIAVNGMRSAAGGAYEQIPGVVVSQVAKKNDSEPHGVPMGNAPNRPKLTAEQAQAILLKKKGTAANGR